MTRNPYTPPATEASIETKSHSIWIKIGAIVSLYLFAGVIQGLIGTIGGMVSAFSKLADSGEPDPSELAYDISFSLLTTLWGWLFSLIGFTFILIYHYKIKLRSSWFYWATIIIAGISTLLIPLGTITGGIVVFIFVKSRKLYQNRS